ncbi:MAG: hypothetical protein RBQ97_07590 [Acholeplasma sp.]|jgi:hypothetical protein|uniref:Uncharacterized protein n=1 Tax=Firmicutes bacterium enrichment culture clone fosmid MGS-M1 TaxID=1549348 RepID=A0A0B5KNE9_9FIRM|nr:hypothetical protein [Firmicutes bacterium enrichment culture clone fosmid MGS-M1]MDY0277931.1 hypothetical protein [Acholeplasma sp.]
MQVVITSIVVGIILILVLALVIYRIYYTYRANKVLKTGVPTKAITPSAVLISLAFLFLVFLNAMLFYQIDFINSRINTVEQQNSDLINTINSISENLSDQILDNTKNTYDDLFEYVGVDGDSVVFNVSFKIKSLDNNATITVLSEDLEGNMTEYSVDINELTYSTTLSLDFEDSYKVYIKIVSADSTFIELIDNLDPYDILSKRFEIYPMRVKYHDNQFKVTFHNQLEMFDNAEGLRVDYIELYYYNSITGESETIRLDDFFTDIGSSYLGESVYIEGIFTADSSQPKDSNITCYVTIFDSDGNVYSFSVEPDYTSEIRESVLVDEDNN